MKVDLKKGGGLYQFEIEGHIKGNPMRLVQNSHILYYSGFDQDKDFRSKITNHSLSNSVHHKSKFKKMIELIKKDGCFRVKNMSLGGFDESVGNRRKGYSCTRSIDFHEERKIRNVTIENFKKDKEHGHRVEMDPSEESIEITL